MGMNVKPLTIIDSLLSAPDSVYLRGNVDSDGDIILTLGSEFSAGTRRDQVIILSKDDGTKLMEWLYRATV